jgi:hypothetical protein
VVLFNGGVKLVHGVRPVVPSAHPNRWSCRDKRRSALRCQHAARAAVEEFEDTDTTRFLRGERCRDEKRERPDRRLCPSPVDFLSRHSRAYRGRDAQRARRQCLLPVAPL